MAPRRGGGSGGSSSGSSGSSPSCGTYNTAPCNIEMNYMYGHAWRPLWSQGENMGQLIMACIWAAAFLILLFVLIRASNRSRKPVTPPPPPPAGVYAHQGQPIAVQPTKPKTKEMRGSGWILQTGITLLFISFVFLAVRYGILTSRLNVLVGYRFESSIVVLLQRLGLPLIFYGLYQLSTPPSSSRILVLLKVPYLLLLVAYTILNIAYLILDFLVSSAALENFKDPSEDRWSWRLGDRDFALTMNKGMVEALKLNAIGYGWAPGYVRWNMYDYDGEPGYIDNRWLQIKLGLASDAVAVVLSLLLLGLAIAGVIFGGSSSSLVVRRGRRMGLLLVAAVGMLLSTLFALIVTAYFVYPNMGVLTDEGKWWDFIFAYQQVDSARWSGIKEWVPPAGFLEGYRVTVDGFPVVQAVLGPLGIVLACLAAVVLVWAETKDEVAQRGRIEDGGLYYEKSGREERLG